MLALIDICQATSTSRGHLCACLDAPGLERLRAFAGDLRVLADEAIFKQGDEADCVFGLRSGTAMLTSRLPDGRRQVLSFLFPGDLFGFADSGQHGCDAIALERLGLCRIPLTAGNDDPPLRRQLLDCARSAQAATMNLLLRIGRTTALERCAFFLVNLWRATAETRNTSEIFLSMRSADIADHLGLRSETVSRQFAKLRREGLISVISPDRFVLIHDIKRLAIVAGLGPKLMCPRITGSF